PIGEHMIDAPGAGIGWDIVAGLEGLDALDEDTAQVSVRVDVGAEAEELKQGAAAQGGGVVKVSQGPAQLYQKGVPGCRMAHVRLTSAKWPKFPHGWVGL
ncbi:MAG: hypothetical protein QXZ09_06615, partial [Candidatus Methanomethylicaceae archaeon]